MRLVEADDLTPAQLGAVERIYVGAFPEDLLAPFPDLFADRMLVLLADDGPAGMALVRDLAGTSWTFLRYYAAGRRGQGIGSVMWQQLTGLLAQEGRTRLVWDVEDPDEPGLTPESVVEHRRRIAFYERLGARLLPVREYHPPHGDGHEPQMLLMDTELGAGDRAGLRELVEAVYWLRYGTDPDHPNVRRTLLASALD